VLLVDELVLDVVVLPGADVLVLELVDDVVVVTGADVVVLELVDVVVGSELVVDVELLELAVDELELVVGTEVDVELVDATGADVEVVEATGFDVELVEGMELEDEVDDDVELEVDDDVLLVLCRVVVEVVVVVTGHETPQHARLLFWMITGGGLTIPVIIGALVRYVSSFRSVAVILPVILVRVLAEMRLVPEGLPPGPIATS
jgi:hypothetical protein